MKTNRLALLLLPLLITMSGCNSSGSNINYFVGDGKSALIDSANARGENTDLITMLKNKDSFVFNITDPSCSSCATFEFTLKSYLEQNPMLIYKINYSVYSRISTTNIREYSLPTSITTPTLCYVYEGKIIRTYTYSKNESVFLSVDELDKTMKRHGAFNKLKYLANSESISDTEVLYNHKDSSVLDTLSGDVVIYSTLDGDLSSLKEYDLEHYAFDATSLITTNGVLDADKNITFLSKYNIDSSYSYPLLATFVDGQATSASSLNK